ncbi:MAG: GWxTD domain-containing protein [Bacteroidota bacterium]
MKIFSILFAAAFSVLTAQVETRKPPSDFDLPEFYIDALSFSTSDSTSSRVDLYIQIPYDALQFVKKDNQYVAKYEVTINFLTEENASVSEKVWSEEIKLASFSQTESKGAYSLTQRSLMIPPGIYKVRSQIRDDESKKVSTVVRRMIVGNYTMRNLAISDIMMVSRVTMDGDRRNIVPNVTGNIGENNNVFYVFFEVYSPKQTDSLELHYVITDHKGNQLLNKYQYYRVQNTRSQIITRFDSSQYSTGAYSISVEAKSLLGGDEILPVLKQRTFVVRWGNIPANVADLDLAIRQLRYIAKEEEYEKIEDAGTDAEKRTLFEEFWKKRDPNPDTKRNEFMEEYYSRVEYANQHFSHYIPGWRTDMGMVFILFGSPNNVERHPFDIDSKPYEVWSYYDYNRSIVFVDETGFGDYRLLTPIWDMLQRLKHY